MDVVQTIEAAKKEMAAGHDKQAARLLTDAAFETHDPDLERQIRELAVAGPLERRHVRQGPLGRDHPGRGASRGERARGRSEALGPRNAETMT